MFDNLSDRLSQAARNLAGKGRLSESNIKDTLRQVRLALLEADVALPVVKSFIEKIQQRAIGEEVGKSLTPGQALIKIIHSELVSLLGSETVPLKLRAQPPVVIFLAGLQGAGKTTTAAKLARRLIQKDKKRVMLVSVDVHRPAAILQLERLASEVGASHCPSDAGEKPEEIARRALAESRRQHIDVLIVDTAGRMHVDAEMMDEVVRVHRVAAPQETFFVIDSMAGQDAVNSARAFDEKLPLTGVILTKADGDAKGGVALSVTEVTGKPIRFMGVGEKTDALELFHPDRMASRILGMGDVLTLIEEARRNVDVDEAKKLAKKVRTGKGFDLEDYKAQVVQMRKMGGISAMLDKLPAELQRAAQGAQVDERKVARLEGIINSMTAAERAKPELIKASRKRRIATGAGVSVQEVNQLLAQFEQAQKMMKMVAKGGLNKMMRGMKGMLPGMR